MSTIDPELLWEGLLQGIEDEQIIPIIGSDLLTIDVDGQPVGFNSHVAQRLAEKLGISLNGQAADHTLHGVACRHVEQSPADASIVYTAVRSVMKELEETQIPKPLQQLAEIKPLKLIVSTTFDRWMERALEKVRSVQAATVGYAPDEKDNDLPDYFDELTGPVVYHLLGVAGKTDFAVTEEDMLEFLHSLQRSERTPNKLLDALNGNDLLIVGCSFPDWLARFLMRIVKGKRLSNPNSRTHVVTGDTVRSDTGLQYFLKHFSHRTRVLGDYGAAQFVDELHRRWTEKHPTVETVAPEASSPDTSPADTSAPPDMEPDAIFLSYASEDRDQAQSIYDALRERHLAVWFDKRELTAGSSWDDKIRRNIQTCSLFVPLISRHTLTVKDRYFRIEWDEAARRAPMRHPDVPFILPVGVDDTKPDASGLPEAIRKVQWESPDRFVEQVVDIFKQVQRANRRTA